eukprot:NODE_503_length_7543_cov_0.274046.p4 type:complete len:117 gc:universal NODE_503_length_7543_cov_0.274046:4799-4449(-)
MNSECCSGSKASSSTLLVFILLKCDPSLSISSSKITGSMHLDLMRELTSLPGILPMYVRLCPFSSLASCNPPKGMRNKGRFNALLMLVTMDVLPVPGGPTNSKILDLLLVYLSKEA